MSRASASVHFPDGTIRHCLYHGTVDCLWPRLFDTSREAWDAYGTDGGERPRAAAGEPVEIYSDYGDGFWWRGTATRDYVTSELDVTEIEELFDGTPDWARP